MWKFATTENLHASTVSPGIMPQTFIGTKQRCFLNRFSSFRHPAVPFSIEADRGHLISVNSIDFSLCLHFGRTQFSERFEPIRPLGDVDDPVRACADAWWICSIRNGLVADRRATMFP